VKAAAAALAVVLAACTAPGGGNARSVTPRPLGTPHPLSVQVALDQDHSVSGIVTGGGGKLTLTGGDGTTFDLDVPKQALLSDEELSLTSVKSVTGMPLTGGLVASVALKPEGLRLFSPATLTIKPATKPNLKQLVGFGFHAGGDQFHGLPLGVAGDAIVVKVLHFSGYGAAQGDPSQLTGHEPTAAEDRADQALSQLPHEPGQLPSPDAIAGVMAGWYRETVAPQLAAAEQDPDAIDDATVEFLAWQRQLDLVGLGDRFKSEIAGGWTSLARGYNSAVDKEHQRCVGNKDPKEAAHIMRFWGAAKILGLAKYGFDEKAADDKVHRCLTFELEFNAAMTAEQSGARITHRILGRATIQVEGFNTWASGEGSEETVEVVWPQTRSCTITAQGTPSTLKVHYLAFDLNFLEVGTAVTPPRDITMLFDPGTPTATVTITCAGDPSGPHVFPGLDIWTPAWRILHKPDEVENFSPTAYGPTVRGYLIHGWEVAGGDPFATKESSRTSGATSEVTRFTLHHTPQP
jgi:hypothetical protein